MPMPVVLSQRSIADEPKPKYLDVEAVIYHYPRVYFKRVMPDDRFVYYRPAKGATTPDAGTYFGFGRLGIPYADPIDASRRFVDIKGYRKFSVPVPVRNAGWTETGTTSSPQFQAAVRELSTYDILEETASHRGLNQWVAQSAQPSGGAARDPTVIEPW
jgi:hypothetical protein